MILSVQQSVLFPFTVYLSDTCHSMTIDKFYNCVLVASLYAPDVAKPNFHHNFKIKT